MKKIGKYPIEVFCYDFDNKTESSQLAIKQQYCKYIKGTWSVSLTNIPIIILINTFLNLFSDWVIETDVVNMHLNKATNIVTQKTLGPHVLAP